MDPDLPVLALTGDTGPLLRWVDESRFLLATLEEAIARFADRTVFRMADWVERVIQGTIPSLLEWGRQVKFIAATAGNDLAAGFRAGADEAGRIAAWMAALPGAEPMATGGAVDRFRVSVGGVVPGPRVDRDIVPALLMPGEVVIRKASVERFGLDELLALNRGMVPPGWVLPNRVQQFHDGGGVGPPAFAPVIPPSPEVARWTERLTERFRDGGLVPHHPEGLSPATAPARLVDLLHEHGSPAAIIELARRVPSVPERARDLARDLEVVGDGRRDGTVGDDRPVGDAVLRALDRYEQRSLAILAAAADGRPLVGSLTVEGRGDGQRDAATIVRELRAERFRSGR